MKDLYVIYNYNRKNYVRLELVEFGVDGQQNELCVNDTSLLERATLFTRKKARRLIKSVLKNRGVSYPEIMYKYGPNGDQLFYVVEVEMKGSPVWVESYNPKGSIEYVFTDDIENATGYSFGFAKEHVRRLRKQDYMNVGMGGVD